MSDREKIMVKPGMNKIIVMVILLLTAALFVSCINLGGVSRLDLEKTVAAMQTQMDDSQRRLNYLQAYLTAQPRLDIECPALPLDAGEPAQPGSDATPQAPLDMEPTLTPTPVPLSGTVP